MAQLPLSLTLSLNPQQYPESGYNATEKFLKKLKSHFTVLQLTPVLLDIRPTWFMLLLLLLRLLLLLLAAFMILETMLNIRMVNVSRL